eukprot:CRZ01530.1 hypothetical protein [Spongospora subterranea]
MCSMLLWFTIALISVILLVSGSSDSEDDGRWEAYEAYMEGDISYGAWLTKHKDREYAAAQRAITTMCPFLYDIDQPRDDSSHPDNQEGMSNLPTDFGIVIYLRRLIRQDLTNLLSVITDEKVTASKREEMKMRHIAKLFNRIIAAIVFLRNPLTAFKHTFSMFDCTADLVRLVWKLAMSNAEIEVISDLISLFPRNAGHMVWRMMIYDGDVPSQEKLFPLLDHPSDIDRLVELLRQYDVDEEVIQSVFQPPSEVGRLGWKLLDSDADTEALKQLSSFFKHPTANARLVRIMLESGADAAALRGLIQFFQTRSHRARTVIRMLEFGDDAGSPEAQFHFLGVPSNVELHLRNLVRSDAEVKALEQLFYENLKLPPAIDPLVRNLLASDLNPDSSFKPPSADVLKSAEFVEALMDLYPFFKRSYDYEYSVKDQKRNFDELVLKMLEKRTAVCALRNLFKIINVPAELNDRYDVLLKVMQLLGIDGCIHVLFGQEAVNMINRSEKSLVDEMLVPIQSDLGFRLEKNFINCILDPLMNFLENPALRELVKNHFDKEKDHLRLEQNRRRHRFLTEFISMIDSNHVVEFLNEAKDSQGAERKSKFGVSRLQRLLCDANFLKEPDWEQLLSPFFDYLDFHIGKVEKNRLGLNLSLVKLIEREAKESKMSLLVEQNHPRDFVLQKLISIIVLKPPVGFEGEDLLNGEKPSTVAAVAGELMIKFSNLQR